MNTALNRYTQALKSQKSDEHYTPKDIVKAVKRAFGTIDLDPCSNSFLTPNVPAKKVFTKEDNGLTQKWEGKVYCNPPFSLVSQFVDKGIREMTYHTKVKSIIYLVKTDNRTKWYGRLMDNCDLFCLYRGYAHFSESEDPAFFGITLFYFGWDTDSFVRSFSQLGWINKVLSGQEALVVKGEK